MPEYVTAKIDEEGSQALQRLAEARRVPVAALIGAIVRKATDEFRDFSVIDNVEIASGRRPARSKKWREANLT